MRISSAANAQIHLKKQAHVVAEVFHGGKGCYLQPTLCKQLQVTTVSIEGEHIMDHPAIALSSTALGVIHVAAVSLSSNTAQQSSLCKIYSDIENMLTYSQ